MEAARSAERTALAETGGVTEGTIAANVAASTPAKPADARVTQTRSRDVDAFARITGREEEWRFTPLARLHGLHDGTAEVDGKLDVAVDAPEGVVVEEIGPEHPLVGSVLVPADRSAALAMRDFSAGTLVSVPAELQLDAPVTVSLRGTGGTALGHVVVDVGAFAKAVVVLDHTGSGRYSGSVEVRVGDSADVTLVSLQEWEPDATHLGAQAALVGRDARYRSIVVTLGGDLVRLVPTVQYAGPGGDAELLGLSFADAAQHLEHRLLVDHAVPRAAAGSPTRARCRATRRTPSGSATSSSARPPPAPTPTSSTATCCSRRRRAPTPCRTSRSRPARSPGPATPAPPAASTPSSCST